MDRTALKEHRQQTTALIARVRKEDPPAVRGWERFEDRVADALTTLDTRLQALERHALEEIDGRGLPDYGLNERGVG